MGKQPSIHRLTCTCACWLKSSICSEEYNMFSYNETQINNGQAVATATIVPSALIIFRSVDTVIPDNPAMCG